MIRGPKLWCERTWAWAWQMVKSHYPDARHDAIPMAAFGGKILVDKMLQYDIMFLALKFSPAGATTRKRPPDGERFLSDSERSDSRGFGGNAPQ